SDRGAKRHPTDDARDRRTEVRRSQGGTWYDHVERHGRSLIRRGIGARRAYAEHRASTEHGRYRSRQAFGDGESLALMPTYLADKSALVHMKDPDVSAKL